MTIMVWATNDTVERDTPESQPNAFTRSSTFLVEVPVIECAHLIWPHLGG